MELVQEEDGSHKKGMFLPLSPTWWSDGEGCPLLTAVAEAAPGQLCHVVLREKPERRDKNLQSTSGLSDGSTGDWDRRR